MDIAEVRKVARLGRLDLSDDDLAEMARQLTAILGYVDQLKELNTDNVEPLAHRYRMSFAPTSSAVSPRERSTAKRAVARAGDFFAVPAILDAADEESH